jgi:hypothetical protein
MIHHRACSSGRGSVPTIGGVHLTASATPARAAVAEAQTEIAA